MNRRTRVLCAALCFMNFALGAHRSEDVALRSSGQAVDNGASRAVKSDRASRVIGWPDGVPSAG